MYAQVTRQKAEEIYRYIHYVFDMQMLPDGLNQGRLQSDAWSHAQVRLWKNSHNTKCTSIIIAVVCDDQFEICKRIFPYLFYIVYIFIYIDYKLF